MTTGVISERLTCRQFAMQELGGTNRLDAISQHFRLRHVTISQLGAILTYLNSISSKAVSLVQ